MTSGDEEHPGEAIDIIGLLITIEVTASEEELQFGTVVSIVLF
jgi:hypothetical protein